MKKRFLSIFLSFAMVLTFVPATGAAAADVELPAGAYEIILDTPDCSIEWTSANVYPAGESVYAFADDTVTFTVEASDVNYEVTSVIINDEAQEIADSYTFTMPAADVIITAAAGKSAAPDPEQPEVTDTHTIAVDVDADIVEITFSDEELDTTAVPYGTAVYFTVEVTDENYTLDKVYINQVEWAPEEDGWYAFTLESDVSITVGLNEAEQPDEPKLYKATLVGGDGAVLNPEYKLPEMPVVWELEAGQPLGLSNPYIKDGYAFAGWENDYNDVIYADREEIPMPAQDVTFTAVWKETPYTVKVTVNDVPDVEDANVEVWAYTDDYMVGDWIGGEDGFQLKLAAGTHTLEVIQVIIYDEETNEHEILRQVMQALVVEGDMSVTVAFPKNNVSAGLVTDTADAPAEDAATPIAVNGATDLADNLFDEYAENAEEGKEVEKVEVEVNVAPKAEDMVEEEHKTAIKDKVKSEEKKESKKFSFLEILISAVISYVDDAVGADEAIIEETKEVVMEIIVDFDMEGKDNFSFYRHHGDSVDKFDVYDKKPDAPKDKMAFFDKENDRIHIYSTKFSTFAISYDDAEVEEDDKDEDKNPSGGDSSGGGYNGPVVIPGKKPDQPKDDQPATVGGFTDVPAGEYYADAVIWAVEKGITNGMGEGTFAPNAACTRAQMVTFLYRVAGEPAVEGTVSFSDVSSDSYYAKAIAWAVEKGITNGMGDGTFAPDAECSRAQMATFLYRMQGGSVSSSSEFTDVDAGAYYAEAVAWAAANNITNGMGDGLFAPNATCTRGQMVTFLFRCFAE